jgi:DNA-binding response OmpR family regulator
MNSNRKILLINSNSSQLKEYATFLNKKGYDILIANNLKQGYEIFLKKIPNIIIIYTYNEAEIELLKLFVSFKESIIINNLTKKNVQLKFDKETIIVENKLLSEIKLLELCKRLESSKEKLNENYAIDVKNVLLVEDNALNQLYFGEILNNLNINYKLCKSSHDAYKEINKNTYHLMVTDVNLKDSNGIDLAKKVLKQFKIPIIIISGYSKTELLNKYGDFECNYILTKPVNDITFSKSICSCLNINNAFEQYIDNSPKTYNSQQISEILRGDKLKIELSLKDFVLTIKNGISTTEKALFNKEFNGLRPAFHELLNLGKYYGADSLIELINLYKDANSIDEKMKVLKKIKNELNELNTFYNA